MIELSAEVVTAAIGSWLLVESIKFIAKKKLSASVQDHQTKLLEDLHKMHSQTDGSGRPIWYVPPELVQIQREIIQQTHDIGREVLELRQSTQMLLTALREINYVNKEILASLARISATLERNG